MDVNELLKSALKHKKRRGSESSDETCDPSPNGEAIWKAIPPEYRAYFNPPRGVCLPNGEYLGTIIQLGSGSLKRLHG